MVNYGNGKVYKIESTLGDKIYVGSTTKAQLSQRMTAHRGGYKRWKDGKCGMTTSFQLFEEYGLENCKIVLLEDCPCETKDQLSAREAHYIRTLECVNKAIPLRTRKEYTQDTKEKKKAYNVANKEVISAKQKEYYEANKEKYQEQRKEHYAENKEKLLEKVKAYQEVNRDKYVEERRARYQVNKEKIQASSQAYYQANREKIQARQKTYRESKKATIE